MDIGENLRVIRARLKITQKDLALKTGIKQPTISAIENGINKPALDTLVLLSNALNCTVSDLIGQTSKKEMDPDTEKLISIFDMLNLAGKNFLLQQAESILNQSAFRKERYENSAI